MIFVVKMDNPRSPDDTGTPTRVRLVGPFANDFAASRWGHSLHSNPHDNPCWQVVYLDSTFIEVVDPAA